MIELRDYQQDLLAQAQGALADPAAGIMLQLPTGGGKTCIAATLLSAWLQNGRKAVWLTHRRELAGQTEEMLQEAGVPASANILWTPHTSAPAIVNGAVILMAQTVSRRSAAAVDNVWRDYDYNDLLIIDEAHHATAGGWTRAISQWPGPVLGMTATPWRLARNEGFEHLFRQLHCGPSVAELQADGWLCKARVIAPPEEEQIVGGQLEAGDYSEAGIEQANRDRDLWTAGAFHFWQKHGENRQTIIYAVSVGHARNLANVFQDAGIATGLLLGDTPDSERAELLYQFRYGGLRVLVNVAVATEGFDLPDAACVALTRPTLSLALYLQMVGRGLRPKEDAGNCLVLDLAGNSRRHGLPDMEHQWSLQPRGAPTAGEEPPVIRCPQCEELSPAASQQCRNCGAPFGELCHRCGAWRPWARWSLKAEIPRKHAPVCDRCHRDAHLAANLPVTAAMRELTESQYADELPPQRDPFLKNFLLAELQQFGGAAEQRKDELRLSIRQRDSALADDAQLERLFQSHIAQLPAAEQPQTMPQRSRLYAQWETDLSRELAQWQAELAALESRRVDGAQVFDAAQKRLLALLAAEGRELGLLTRQPSSVQIDTPDFSESGGGWMTFAQLMQWGKEDTGRDSDGPLRTYKPTRLQGPWGEEIPVRSWARLLAATAEWLVREGLLTREVCPVTVGSMNGRYLVSETIVHPSGHKSASMRLLSNGLYIELRWNTAQIPLRCQQLLEKFGQDPAQFQVWVR